MVLAVSREDRKRQPDPERDGVRGGKKQVVDPKDLELRYCQKMLALGWESVPDPEEYFGWCTTLSLDPMRIRREIFLERVRQYENWERSISGGEAGAE